MRPSLAPSYLNFSWSFQAFKSYKQTRGCVNLFTTASVAADTKAGNSGDWVSWDETCTRDFKGWCNERRSWWWRKFRPNDEDSGVVQYARSATSTPLSGRWQAHPRDGGLVFADLVALSVGSECMGVVMKIWDMSRAHKWSCQLNKICEKLASARLLRRSRGSVGLAMQGIKMI